MTMLVLASAFWIALHALLAGPLRPAIAGRTGELGFRGLFSLLSVAGLAALVWAYGRAPHLELWPTVPALRWLAVLLMLPAFLLFVPSLSARNPTLAGADMLLRERLPAEGIVRVTRHPMLWAFSLWAAAHLLANGDLASLLFFGSFLAVSLNGMASIDRKRRRAAGEAAWSEFAARTSRLPFAAIAAGRNTFSLREIGWWRIGVAVLLWAAAMHLHAATFGVPVLPR